MWQTMVIVSYCMRHEGVDSLGKPRTVCQAALQYARQVQSRNDNLKVRSTYCMARVQYWNDSNVLHGVLYP